MATKWLIITTHVNDKTSDRIRTTESVVETYREVVQYVSGLLRTLPLEFGLRRPHEYAYLFTAPTETISVLIVEVEEDSIPEEWKDA